MSKTEPASGSQGQPNFESQGTVAEKADASIQSTTKPDTPDTDTEQAPSETNTEEAPPYDLQAGSYATVKIIQLQHGPQGLKDQLFDKEVIQSAIVVVYERSNYEKVMKQDKTATQEDAMRNVSPYCIVIQSERLIDLLNEIWGRNIEPGNGEHEFTKHFTCVPISIFLVPN